MMAGVMIDDIFNVLCDSISSMKQYMSEPDYNLAEIKIRISQILNNLN